MKNILLSIIGVAAFATFTTRAEAHDSCYRADYGYRPYYGYPSYGRTYYVERPVYYRSYSPGYCEPRYVEERHCEKRRHHHHHGLHGLLEALFR